MESNTPSKLWVGHIHNKGNALFDPDIQVPDSPLVYLFIVGVTGADIEAFRSYDVKKQLTKLNPGQSVALNAIYAAWKLREGPAFIQNEIHRIEKHRQAIAAANQKFLARFGLPFHGVRNNVNKPLRTAPCWHCQKEIDNTSFLECVKCGWIICTCGACGCAYTPGHARSSREHR